MGYPNALVLIPSPYNTNRNYCINRLCRIRWWLATASCTTKDKHTIQSHSALSLVTARSHYHEAACPDSRLRRNTNPSGSALFSWRDVALGRCSYATRGINFRIYLATTEHVNTEQPQEPLTRRFISVASSRAENGISNATSILASR